VSGTIRLENLIEKSHIKCRDFNGDQELEAFGVSNTNGIARTTHRKSDDLGEYLVIEPGSFAYNPYRVNVGSIGLTPANVIGVVSPAYVVFRAKKQELLPEVLLDFLKSSEGLRQINKLARGTVRKALRYEDLCEIEFPAISYERQLEILEYKQGFNKQHGSLLSEIAHQKVLLTKLKQVILQEAIQGKLTAVWRASHSNVEPASQLLDRIQSEKNCLITAKKLRSEKLLPKISITGIPFKIPKGWEWCRLGRLYQSLQYGTSLKCSYDSSKNTAILRIPNVSTGKLSTDDLKFTNLTKSEKEKYSLKKHDVLMIRSNGSASLVGSAVHFDEEAGNYGYAGYLMRLRFPTEIYSPFVVLTLASRTLRDQIEGPLRTTVGINNVNSTEVSNLKIPLPPFAEQVAIVERVEELMTTCHALETAIEHSRTHAAHLLQAVLKEAFAPAATT